MYDQLIKTAEGIGLDVVRMTAEDRQREGCNHDLAIVTAVEGPPEWENDQLARLTQLAPTGTFNFELTVSSQTDRPVLFVSMDEDFVKMQMTVVLGADCTMSQLFDSLRPIEADSSSEVESPQPPILEVLSIVEDFTGNAEVTLTGSQQDLEAYRKRYICESYVPTLEPDASSEDRGMLTEDESLYMITKLGEAPEWK